MTGTLEIAAAGADATLIHYQKDLILERLALALGSAMVTDFKVVHHPAALSKTSAVLPTGPTAPSLDLSQQRDLQQDLAEVTDPELRAVLMRLGTHVLAAEKKP